MTAALLGGGLAAFAVARARRDADTTAWSQAVTAAVTEPGADTAAHLRLMAAAREDGGGRGLDTALHTLSERGYDVPVVFVDEVGGRIEGLVVEGGTIVITTGHRRVTVDSSGTVLRAEVLESASAETHEGDVVASTPDGRLRARVVGSHGVEVVDVAGTRVAAHHGHAATVRALAFSEDGRFLVSGGDDGMVRFLALDPALARPGNVRLCQDGRRAVAVLPMGDDAGLVAPQEMCGGEEISVVSGFEW
jgi:WD40 repeat protein